MYVHKGQHVAKLNSRSVFEEIIVMPRSVLSTINTLKIFSYP